MIVIFQIEATGKRIGALVLSDSSRRDSCIILFYFLIPALELGKLRKVSRIAHEVVHTEDRMLAVTLLL